MTNEKEDLERLKNSTEHFVGEVFDWVTFLDQKQILPALYALQIAIDKKIEDMKVKKAS